MHPLVLHCVASGGLYGIERFLLYLLPALTRSGCRVELVCIADRPPGGDGKNRVFSGHALADAYAATGGAVHLVEMRGRMSLGGLWRLDAVLRRTRPVLLHTHGYKASILLGLLARLHRLPIVATYHGEAKHAVEVERYVAIETRFLRHFRGAAAVSEAIREGLLARGLHASRVRVIPNAVADPQGHTPRQERLQHHGPTLCTAARLVPEKNLHVLLDALARLRDRFPRIRLLIAGEGPCRGELERQARAVGVDRQVEFRGFVDDVVGLMAGSDCFVLPSRTEGMPIALIEAMSAGCPIVASSVGSIPRIAEGGRNLVLVEPNDTGALTQAIAAVLGDRAYARQLAANAREKFERDHTVIGMARAYLEFYEWVLQTSVVAAEARPPSTNA